MHVLIPLILLAFNTNTNNLAAAEFSVYDPVPGLDPSPYYEVRIREQGTDDWYQTFVLFTECTEAKYCNFTSGIFDHLGNWSNSYLNFEMEENGSAVEVEITMLFGNETISKAVVHPKSASDNCVVENGKAYVTISRNALFTVDINGQMDDQDTGRLPGSRGKCFKALLKGAFSTA